MKVLLDHQAFFMQKYGGISFYFAEIIKKMYSNDLVLPVVNDFVSNNVNKEGILPFIEKKRVFSDLIGAYYRFNFISSIKVAKNYNRFTSIVNLKRNDFDIFHPTYYDPYFISYLKDKPYVLTVHDMIHEKLANFFPKDNQTVKNKRKLIKNAARIIAISKNTKHDITTMIDIDPEKIDVVYHGFHKMTNHFTKSKSLPDKYLLYVGERKGYKNFCKFIYAYAKVRETIPDVKLVCTGHPFSKEELLVFKSLRLESSILHFFAHSYKDISVLYSNAELFVFPSLYEGFGIPILEAFSCNCPIALSNASCFPEIAANAAEYFDPMSKESICKSILKVLQDSYYKKELIENGKICLKNFSWEKSALQTFQVYEKTLSVI